VTDRDVIAILGAADPEMERIEAMLTRVGVRCGYALDARGSRVRGADAYSAVGVDGTRRVGAHGEVVYLIECAVSSESMLCLDLDGCEVVTIDHHRPGDPGYGQPPEEFLPASSLGQVLAELARLGRLPPEWPQRDDWSGYCLGAISGPPWAVCTRSGEKGRVVRWTVSDSVGLDEQSTLAEIPRDLVLAAAADHCLPHAYAGWCPGVDPDELMRWRVQTRAAFQGRPVEAVLADIEVSRRLLRQANLGRWGGSKGVLCADLRPGKGVVCAHHFKCDGRTPQCWADTPELPEAAAREGIPFLGVPRPATGATRQKVVLMGDHRGEAVRAFLGGWAAADGLVDLYGDPARGFAGGYREAT